MTIHEASYLLRYAFTMLLSICTGLLLSVSFLQFRDEAAHCGSPISEHTRQGPVKTVHRQFAVAWVCMDLFLLCAGSVMFFLAPAAAPALRLWIAAYMALFMLAGNLLLLLLPRRLPCVDRIPLLCLLLLSMLGMLFQTRLSLAGLPLDGIMPSPEAVARAASLLRTQALAHAAGMLAIPLVLLFVFRVRRLEPLGILGIVVTPLLLLVTLLFGRGAASHGATLWIDVGGFSFQLTEFAKIAYLFVLAWFFKRKPSLRQQLLFAIWAAFTLMLVVLLPDLGAALILVPVTLIVFLVATSAYGVTLGIVGAGAGMATLAYLLFPHVQRRLAGWATLWQEVNDGNRQIVYGLQALARGGLLGTGVGNGSPAGIPLASSDMIFAVVCEELGLLTGICILVLFVVTWLRAARVGLCHRNGFQASLALGIGSLLFMEAVIVIAGSTGLIPLTGATLPLIARGGSSVLAKYLMFALLVGLSAREKAALPPPGGDA